MTRFDVYLIADALLEQHGLKEKGWRLCFDNSKHRLGQCRYSRREIGVSKAYVALNDEATIRDTLLHEIAHALAGPGINHGPIWQRIAERIGAVPERCKDAAQFVAPEKTWIAECPNCDNKVRRHRKARRSYSCSRCSGPQYNPAFELRWRRV